MAAMRTFGYDKNLTCVGIGAFREQIGLDQAGDLPVERNPALLVALTTTRTQPRGISTSRTCKLSTSAERNPLKSISPAIARSRSVRKLPNSACASPGWSPRGNRRGSRKRKPERGLGWAR